MESLPTEILFDICSWLPLRGVLQLRQCSKKYQILLLSKDDAHWKKRIESTFPINFQNILDQDVKQQIGKFACFRTLDTGNNIKRIDLIASELTERFDEEDDDPIQSGRDISMLKLPWTDSTLLLKISGSLFLFDIAKEALLAKIDLMARTMWLDVPNRKVACVYNRSVRVYSLANNSFEFEYESTFQSPNPQVFPILANDCIVSFNGENQLEWYSLKTNEIQRTLECQDQWSRLTPRENSTFIYEVFIDYEEESDSEFIKILQIDCASETEPKLIIKEKVAFDRAELVQITAIENEYGQQLQVYYKTNTKVAMNVFDMRDNSLQFYCVNQGERPYKLLEDMTRIAACPGAQIYLCMNYEDNEAKVYKYTRNQKIDAHSEPYWSHRFNGDLGGVQFLTPDIMDITYHCNNNVMDIFYFISKNRIIGHLEGHFSDLISIGGKIVAFNAQTGVFYIISLNIDANDEMNDRYIQSLFPHQTKEPTTNRRQERSDDSSEEPAKKRQKLLIEDR